MFRVVSQAQRVNQQFGDLKQTVARAVALANEGAQDVKVWEEFDGASHEIYPDEAAQRLGERAMSEAVLEGIFQAGGAADLGGIFDA